MHPGSARIRSIRRIPESRLAGGGPVRGTVLRSWHVDRYMGLLDAHTLGFSTTNLRKFIHTHSQLVPRL